MQTSIRPAGPDTSGRETAQRCCDDDRQRREPDLISGLRSIDRLVQPVVQRDGTSCVLTAYTADYNHYRTHQSLDNEPPIKYARLSAAM